ncbi:MAG: BspA family leucine-rich repeat surface protein [Paludibacteraceae bacterium]|nr:BspA family leucine-rich repeat surface protein [Paludibacteraceae bacterium]
MSTTLQQAITALKARINNAYAAVAAKGGTLPEKQNTANLAAAIQSIPTAASACTLQDFINAGGKLGYSNLSELTATVRQLDFSNVSDMQNFFRYAAFPNATLALGGDLPNTSYSYAFANVSGSGIDLDAITNNPKLSNITYLCNSSTSLVSARLSRLDVSDCQAFAYTFNNCTSLELLDITGWDLSKSTNNASMFAINNSKLTTLIGNHTLQEVENGGVMTCVGLKQNLDISRLTLLDRASLLAVIKGMADLTGQTGKTLTLGTALLEKLNTADIQLATNKNWTLA